MKTKRKKRNSSTPAFSRHMTKSMTGSKGHGMVAASASRQVADSRVENRTEGWDASRLQIEDDALG